MQRPLNTEELTADLKLPWIVVGMMLTTLVVYLMVCFTVGAELQQPMDEITRVKIRTAFYVLTIVTFPMTRLLRHIQLRLNQTMPRTLPNYRVEAKKRYLVTVIVSMALIETVGLFGFILFMLGDSTNNLFILVGLSAFGMFFYRPKIEEYRVIVDALANKPHE
jgi:nitrate reductase NapE component